CLFPLAASPAEDPDWLANPGFEAVKGEAPDSWDLGMEGAGEGKAVWQKGDAHSGERCLRVQLTTNGDYYMGRQRLSQPVTPGELYQISGWYRSDAEIVAHPCVYNVRGDGFVLSAWESVLPKAETWTRFHYTWRPPDGTVRFEIQLRAQSVIGTAWFDDMTLGPAAQLEAEMKARMAKLKEQIQTGDFQLRALRPSERPQLLDLAEKERFEELQSARSVSIFAARDERESFGALVMGMSGGSVTARVTDLKGPRGARIPASEIKVRWAEWVSTRGAAVPDPLLERQPFTMPKDGFPILWVTVHVPRNKTPAGLYRGEMKAESNGQSTSLPLALQVYNFSLPKTTYLQSSFWVFRHTVRNFYSMKEVPFDFYKKFLDLCLESRLAPIDAAEWHDQPYVRILRDEKGELQVDWQVWDRYLGHCMDRGMSAFNVADDHWFGSYFRAFYVCDVKTGKVEAINLDMESDAYAAVVTRFFRLAREHFTKKGWAKRAYLQGYDEPGQDAKLLDEIKRFYDLARQGWPELRTLITATPQNYTALHGSVGIWCPLTPGYDKKVAEERRKQGEEVWWYVCCGPTAPWANFFLDQPGAAHRVLFWQTFDRKSDGLLYWGVNHWPGFDGRTMEPLPPDRKWPGVPWNDGSRNGDGYFLYPGPEGPLTSLRFEIMRDGVEDYDALRLLEELVRRKTGRAPAALLNRARQALTLTPDLFKSMTNYPSDAGAMVDRRREVNELIVLMSRV
ncbi:MAG: DUF4091 domain-containing protein, partial [Armatimonadetes bacterium]|nr:DUF4091 domain-containing protein [Armatimonadota bacterium]